MFVDSDRQRSKFVMRVAGVVDNYCLAGQFHADFLRNASIGQGGIEGMVRIECPDMNHRIWKLWRNADDRLRGSRIPKFVFPPSVGGIVFLGLNPSFPSTLPPDLKDRINQMGLTWPDDFDWEASGLAEEFVVERANVFAAVHETARDQYPFFQRLQAIANSCGHNKYEMIDLFLRLEADSGRLPKEYKAARNHRYRPDPEDCNFVICQLDVCHDLIVASKPCCIVSVYAGVADIFMRYYKWRYKGNFPDLGNIRYENSNPKLRKFAIPVTWSNEPVPFFRCSYLPIGDIRRQMTDNEFDETVRELKRYCPGPQ